MLSTPLRRIIGAASLAVLAGLASFPAFAQFSAPYDPDFPAEKKAEAEPAKPAPVEEAVPLEPVSGASTAPFRLLDRPSGAGFLTPAPVASTEPAKAPRDPAQVRAGMAPVQYDAARFERVREAVDRGEEPGEERTGPDGGPQLVNEDVGLSTAAPKPPPPEVELPTYGTSLSVTGRKVIGFNFSEKRFLNTQKTTGRAQTTNLVEIDQQLQLRMQGKVGPKITVNVDYDDTKLNQQDISVVYQGDPNEVVQNVSFGDIDLSLPATEFVSYNKQLFGIRADVKYKGFRSTFIGSRTKGTTKTKQFTGNSQFVALDLQDTSYLRRQYYDVTFDNAARLPLRAGSERVFLAKQEIGVTNLNEQNLVVDDIVLDGDPVTPGVQTSTFSGKFLPLVAGQDYTIDYAKGIIQFRNQLLPQYVVAIDYLDNGGNQLTLQSSSNTLAAGGSGRFKLIKTPSDVPIAEANGSTLAQAGYNRELKTFYSIGQNQIVRDNGRGNFILRVLDQNRVEVGSGLQPQQKYPDTILVDFENGIFQLKAPFSVSNASPTTPDPDIYAQTPISKRIIRLEYNYRFKTFFLEPNLVVQSEIVILDGQKLTRNVDYFIDYEAGFITFFNPDRITPGSTIDMSFEVAPFANLNNDTLLGARVSHEWGGGKYSVGSTMLYQAGSKSPTVPQITELAKSLLVYEFDAQAKRIQLGKRLIVTLAGEFAQSRQNLNLNPFALIDNMEGIKQEDQTSTLAAQWQIASNPNGVPASPSQLNWITEDVNVLSINPRAQATANESQKVLQFQYGNTAPLNNNDEVSIVFPFSISGIDVSQKTILEVVMLGDNSNNRLNIRLGGIDENADGSGILRTEDANNDGILQPGEDIGFLYGVAPTARYGASNGIIDSFDLNKNGILNPDDLSGGNFGYACGGSASGNNCNFHDVTGAPVDHVNGVIDFDATQWHTLQIPLNISTATASRFTSVKHLRLTIRGTGGVTNGTLKFARIAVVGNTWQRGTAGDPAVPGTAAQGTEALTVTPVNSVDNPTYAPIFNAAGDASQVFNDLYGSLSTLQKQSNTKNLSEQALQLEYANLAAGTTVYTKRLFSRAIDISQHRYFNFLVFGNAAGVADVSGSHVFFLRAGADQDFFEVQVPINFSGWKKIRVEQTSRANNSVMDGWKADTPGSVVISSGNPNLQQVGALTAGVYTKPGATQTNGALYLNEIHVAEPVTRVGTANKIQADFESPGWATFGLKHRSIDRNFQTPTSVVSNQDNTEDSSYLNLMRFAWFPMSFSINRHITDTPSTVQTGNLSNLVNLLQQGKVTTWTGSATGNIAYGAYPRMSLAHTRNRVEYDLLTRLDDRQTFSGTLQYGVPSQSRFLPRTIDANAGHTRYDVTFNDPFVKRQVGNFDTAERTNSYGVRLAFTPWSGSSFNPSWSMTKVTESRVDSTGVAPISTRYPKSFSQSAGFASNYRLTSWLNPQINYQIDTIENNILSVSTFVLVNSTYVFQPGDIKTVNRSANASVSLPIQISDIFPKTKLFHSVNIISGYQLQDGDVWNQVEKDLSTQKALWIRTPLRPSNPVAQRVNLTLRDTWNSTQRWSPLDGYALTGRAAALRSLSLSNNYVLSVQRNEVTGTPSKTIARTLPDAVVSISQLEQLWHTERWMANTQMNFKYSKRTTENVGSTLQTENTFGTDLRTIVIKRYETLVSYNQRTSNNKDLRIEANTQNIKHEDVTTQVTFDIRKFRITPKVDYSKDTTKLGTGVKTQDVEVITPSVLMRADLALPAGLRLPGSAKPLLFTNRIIWTTTASLAQRRSPVTVADNSRLFSLNTSGDYEIAKNLRMTLNGSAQRLWHKFLKEEDFIAYAFGTTLTFQF